MPRDRGRKGEKNPLEVAEEKRAKTARRRSGCWRSATRMLLGRMRWDIQRLPSGPDPHQLTREEIGAIHLYTQDGPWYEMLNWLLRTEDRNQLKQFFAFLKMLLTMILMLSLIHI